VNWEKMYHWYFGKTLTEDQKKKLLRIREKMRIHDEDDPMWNLLLILEDYLYEFNETVQRDFYFKKIILIIFCIIVFLQIVIIAMNFF
jgi:hypothetical protein